MSKPLILAHYEFDNTKHAHFLIEKKKTFTIKCKYCSKEISAAIDITSNWVSHLKIRHVDQFSEFEKLKSESNKQNVKCYIYYFAIEQICYSI